MVNILTFIICVVVGLLCGIGIGFWIVRSKIVEITDDKPVQDTKVANAMQLSNELQDYIYEKDGRLCIKVVKHKK